MQRAEHREFYLVLERTAPGRARWKARQGPAPAEHAPDYVRCVAPSARSDREHVVFVPEELVAWFLDAYPLARVGLQGRQTQ